jgi:energy-coupling factor transporter ATP-binding protein EcfA2
MTTLRIDRIKVNRGGPLETDFDVQAGDLNLIYGPNETGKTYLVESLIKFLFKTSARAPVKWDLRGWDIAGKVIVSGLESDPVSFTKAGKKLEDYWADGTGLPLDLSRLLVVRGGETLLADAADGVGRDMLKGYLSGEGLLDRVASQIEAVIQAATVEGHQIVGSRQGKLKTRTQHETQVENLQALLDEVEERYASGETYLLRQRKEARNAEVETLQKAKRYQAARLADTVSGLKSEQRKLPTAGELATLSAEVTTYETNKAEIDTKSDKLGEMEKTDPDFQWTTEALKVYKEVTSGVTGGGPQQIFIILSLVSFVGTVAFGLLGLRIPLVVSAVLSGIFYTLSYRDAKKALSRAGENTELERVKAEYRTRFGSDLTDRGALQAKLEELNKIQILATPLREELNGLTDETTTLERRTAETLKTWTGGVVPAQEWRDTIRALTGKGSKLQDTIDSIREELELLGISSDQYLDDDPGREWSSERYAEVVGELHLSKEALDKEDIELRALKARVSQEMGIESSDWEELITRLRDQRDEAARDYGEVTAEILAKIQVNAVLQEVKKEENLRIVEGLKREELTKPLRALTGRYQSIRLDDDEGLVLVSDEDEEYPLASMSTGAREQVFLALRMGFASITMEGQGGFLILDDAFQHSDWNRRENLVARTLRFVESGWQVFYFTMDDHIKELFEKEGAQMGDRFGSHQLG